MPGGFSAVGQDEEPSSPLLSKANRCAPERLCRLQTRLVTNHIAKLTLSLRGSFVLRRRIDVESKERVAFFSHSAADTTGEAKANIRPLSVAMRSDARWPLHIPVEMRSHWESCGGLPPSQMKSCAVQDGFCKSHAAVAAVAVTVWVF